MTTPEKLFVFVVEGEEISAFKEEAAALAIRHCIATRGTTDPAEVSPVQAYVREDVAAAREAAAEAKYKNRDVEVMRVALADLRRIRGCLATRANTLRTIGEEDRAMGLEDAIKQLDEEVFT